MRELKKYYIMLILGVIKQKLDLFITRNYAQVVIALLHNLMDRYPTADVFTWITRRKVNTKHLILRGTTVELADKEQYQLSKINRKILRAFTVYD